MRYRGIVCSKAHERKRSRGIEELKRGRESKKRLLRCIEVTELIAYCIHITQSVSAVKCERTYLRQQGGDNEPRVGEQNLHGTYKKDKRMHVRGRVRNSRR